MDLLVVFLAAVGGYLIGSISFARLVVRVFAPQQNLRQIEVEIPGSEVAYRSDAVSGTSVNLQLGPKYGCLTSILDMLKVAAPALALKLSYPQQAAYYLIFAAMGTLGHNWPLYYRFQGGRGVSTILGGMLVVDWLGVVVVSAVGLGVGALLRSFHLVSFPLMIPWLWFRHHDWRLVAYAVAVNVMNGIALLPEARETLRLRREGTLQDFMHAKTVRVAGDQEGETVERLTQYGMLASFFSRSRREDIDPGESTGGAT